MLPKISPLVLKRRAATFDNPDSIFDLKCDGFRALLEGAGARFVSRKRNRFKHMEALAAALAKRLRVTDAILDGELTCADASGRPSEDLRLRPPIERKTGLKRLLRRRSNHLIAEAMSVEGRGKALMASVEEHDLEGVFAKRKCDP